MNIILPEMGEGVIEGTIARWLKQEGEAIKQYEPLIEIETDKVTTEITAEVSGILTKIEVPAGKTIPVGTLLGVIQTAGESAPPPKPQQPEPTPAPMMAAPAAGKPKGVNGTPHASRQTEVGWVSPVVAKMAAEYEVDLTAVSGTGMNGRITKQDVQSYLAQRNQTSLPAAPTPVVAKVAEPVRPTPPPTPVATPPAPSYTPAPAPVLPPAGEVVPLTAMRRAIAEHMVQSKRTSPHVTTVFEFDFTAVTNHRNKHKNEFAKDGVKLTYMPYIVHATVQALKKHPMVNATWTDDGVLLKKEINLGMAAAIPAGLIVPVIKGADGMNLLGLARTINDLADRARANRLQPAEVQGGTFTITNHGASGSLIGTPIINQPQVGILGIGVIEKRVKVVHDAIAIRPCAYVSFSFDHRILDGATADAFVMSIKEMIEHWA